MTKCRSNCSFRRVEYFLKKAPEYLIYLVNQGAECWTTSYATKSGHFSVITTGKGEPKKFLVGLRFLSYPPFVRLLEAAEREFGYQQGVLIIPCEASELQQILSHF
ncbi:hypothetical protein ACS0TY_015868 [Phlomoides rotata]